MSRPIQIQKSYLFTLFFIISILAGLLFYYPKWLLKIRNNTKGYVLVYNDLDTIADIVLDLNDSSYISSVKANSGTSFNITHKISNNKVLVNLNKSYIVAQDTFSLPFDEGCCICIGIDHSSDSIGTNWDNDSTILKIEEKGFGEYLRKPQIIIKKNIRLKVAIQQVRLKKYIF